MSFASAALARIGWLRLVTWGAIIAVIVEAAWIVAFSPGSDAHAYWAASWDAPYAIGRAYTTDAYLYSPAFLQALTPLRLLPWPMFWAAWVTGSTLILVWLTGPILAAIVLIPTPFSPVFTELWHGNVVMPMAVVLALGLRHPALWSFMFLTKVTPGIGIIWFAVRREWRSLAIAVGATAAIALLSYALAPGAWADWVATLRLNAVAPEIVAAHLPPLGWRLAIAAILIGTGAWFNERRVLPLAIIIALPEFWYASLSLLLVMVWQLRDDRRHRHGDP